MPKKSQNQVYWVESELRLGGLDSRMIGLLQAIDQSGSINRAAKLMGLSYKGAWQMIERANLGLPSSLIVTFATGSKGGGTHLSDAGKTLVKVYNQLRQQNNDFLQQLNNELSNNQDIKLLLERQQLKTSIGNPLYGTIDKIVVGAVNVEVFVKLKGGKQVCCCISLDAMREMGIKYAAQVVVLVNSTDINVVLDADPNSLSARNCLSGKIIRIQQDDVNALVTVGLSDGERLNAMLTQENVAELGLKTGLTVNLIFKIGAAVLGIAR